MIDDETDEPRPIGAVEVLDRETGKLRVAEDKCTTCILRPGNPAQLREGRLGELVDSTRDTFVVCHKTLHLRRKVLMAVCHGFYTSYKDSSPTLKTFAEHHGVLFVNLAELGVEPPVSTAVPAS